MESSPQYPMKTICSVIAALAVGYTVNLDGQVVNGDFSAGTNGWNFVFPPSNVYFPNYGLGSIDIDGPGPLPVSDKIIGTSAVQMACGGYLVTLSSMTFMDGRIAHNYAERRCSETRRRWCRT